MNEKLTLADCFKYPNASLIGYNSLITKDAFKLINLQEQCIETYNEGRFYLADCKLQLRPLSGLTDEEQKFIEHNFNEDYCIDWNIDFEELLNVLGYEYHLRLIDYFRSINIDIDGFIEAGKAVSQ